MRLAIVHREMAGRWPAARPVLSAWRPNGHFAVEIYEWALENFGGDAPAWDLMTAAVMVDPSLCGFASLPLDVDTTDGDNSGQMVVVEGGAPAVDFCLAPDAGRIKQNLRDVLSASGP